MSNGEAMVAAGGALATNAMSVQDVLQHRGFIKNVMTEAMEPGRHYGTIPGCGDKLVLFKEGGELLMMIFRMHDRVEWEFHDLPGEHREYTAKVSVYASDDTLLATGMGSCTTMESKYRYRPGPVVPTGKPVPKQYWNIRDSQPGKAQELLGGKGFSAKKVNGHWEIVEKGESVENQNPADEYNTVLQMAVKRAQNKAIVKATACSDVFAPEGDPGDMPQGEHSAPRDASRQEQAASEAQLSKIRSLIDNELLTDQEHMKLHGDMNIGFSAALADQAIQWAEDLIASRRKRPVK